MRKNLSHLATRFDSVSSRRARRARRAKSLIILGWFFLLSCSSILFAQTQIGTKRIQDGAITQAKIAEDSVSGDTQIIDDTITEQKLNANDAPNTTQIMFYPNDGMDWFFISELEEYSTPDSTIDYLLIYDTTTGLHKKILPQYLETLGGGGGGSTENVFRTIDTPQGTNPVADSPTDTLTLNAGEGIVITGDETADSILIECEIADTENKGIASFDEDDFMVTAGHVSIKGDVTALFRNANDFDSIQDALDDLPEEGGMVFVPEGTHTITSTILMKSNQALVGAGPSSIITTAADDINLIDVVGINAYPNDYKEIVIANLKLQNIGSGTGNGIRLRRAHNVSLKNLFITQCYSGIFFDAASTYDADNNIISNCMFLENFYAGIYAVGYSAACEENVISNNVFVGNLTGIEMQCTKSTIIGNTIEESGNCAILLFNGDLTTVTGNTCCQSVKHGIHLKHTDQNIVANNIVKDNDRDNTATYNGIYISDNSDRNIIKGNVCKNNDNYEISIQDTDCQKNIIANNVCWGTDHEGAIRNNGAGTVLDNNVID